MVEIDAETLLQHATLIGLISREQAREAKAESDDGSMDAVARVLMRHELLTSWQFEKIKKGDLDGFFYGGCKVLFHIAEGSFARVYRGRKLPGNQSVAVKVLRQRFVADAAAVERFNQEAEAGMKLIHPNIVRTLEFGEQNQKYFMIMEYVEGSNLKDFLRLRGRVAPEQALPLLVGLSRGLKFSLEHGVTHRDIKATNILIANNGEAKLVDFGLATIEGEDKKMAAAHGQRTVDYSALERTCGSTKGDPRSDIFFLGCVFYHLLTGQNPLPEQETKDPMAKMLKRGINSIKPISEHRLAPPAGLCQVIERMMKVDLKARYSGMDQVVADLEGYQASLSAHAPGMPQRTPRKRAERSGRPTANPAAVVGGKDDVNDSSEFNTEVFEYNAVRTPTILCVEVQEEIREAFRKTLSRMGYRVLLVGDAERAAERYREATPDAVIFDVDGQGSTALEAFLDMHDKAHEDGHDLAGLVILGPKQHYLASNLPTDDRLVVLTKPIKMKTVQDAITELVPVR